MEKNQLMAILSDEGALAGVGYLDLEAQNALLGAIQQLPAPEKSAAMQKLFKRQNVNSNNLSSRGEIMARLGQITDKDVVQALVEGRAQISDFRGFAVKVASSVASVKMLIPSDTSAVGTTNIDNAKMPDKYWTLITGIKLLSGVDADKLNAAYDTIAKAIANGTFEFKANGEKYLLPKDTSCNVFDTSNRSDIENGLFKLDNPKLLAPNTRLTFDLAFSQASVANTNVRLELVGSQIIPF